MLAPQHFGICYPKLPEAAWMECCERQSLEHNWKQRRHYTFLFKCVHWFLKISHEWLAIGCAHWWSSVLSLGAKPSVPPLSPPSPFHHLSPLLALPFPSFPLLAGAFSTQILKYLHLCECDFNFLESLFCRKTEQHRLLTSATFLKIINTLMFIALN